MKEELLDQNKTSQWAKKDGSPNYIEEGVEAEKKNEKAKAKLLKHTRSSQDVEVKEEKDKVEKPKQHNSRTIATSKPIKVSFSL